MKAFRNLVFWCHLVVGSVAALVILVMSVTGVLLTYEKQMTASADKRAYRVQASGARLSAEALLTKVAEAEGRPPANLTLRADPAAPAEASFGRGRTLFVDPYSGRILGDGGHGTRAFFRTVTDWHRWLAQQGEGRDTARAITGASNLGFLFLVVSGFYLWWPRNWSRKALRNVTWFRRGVSGKARDFNWHNVIGLWSTIPLFVVVLSGVVISYPWASNAVYGIYGEKPPVRRGGGPGGEGVPERGGRGGRREGRSPVSFAGIDRLWARAEKQVEGWRSISLAVPREADAPVAFTIDRGTAGQPQLRGKLTLDRRSGEPTEWETFGDNTPGRRLRSILRFAHTGEVLGLPGQTVAGLASLGGAFLVWTGIALALRRFQAWRGRRARATQGEAARDPEPSPE
jgi:uncharacterized iron-regulated membrane protein